MSQETIADQAEKAAEPLDTADTAHMADAQPIEQPAPVPVPAKRRGLSGEVKLFIGITIGALVLVGFTFGPMLMKPAPPYKVPDPAPVKRDYSFFVPPGSHVVGDPKVPFTLVEFSDLECGHCKMTWPMVEKLLKQHSSQMKVVFRHFRAAQGHAGSQPLAQAAEAAGVQGKFFEMVKLLFDKQDIFEGATPSDIASGATTLAGSLGLDVQKFKKDMESQKAVDAWVRDNSAGIDLKVEGTPTWFFLRPDGQATGLYTYEQLDKWLKDPKHWQ